MVPTEPAVQVQDGHQRILDLLNRQEVMDEMEKYDISKVVKLLLVSTVSRMKKSRKLTGGWTSSRREEALGIHLQLLYFSTSRCH